MSQITLADLGEVTVNVPVERPDGQVFQVPLRTLSEGRMRDIRASVTWPEPPIRDYKKIGSEVIPVYDRAAPAYLAADREADAELSYKALLASLAIDVPGETEAEKLAALRNGLGAYAFTVLLTAVNRINLASPEEIAAVARSFQRTGVRGASGNGRAEPDALTVAQPTPERAN